MKSQTVQQTIAQAARTRPVFRPILEAFEPILTQRGITAAKLAPLLAQAAISLPTGSRQRPLLQETLPTGLGSFVIMAAEDLLPLLCEQIAIAPHKDKLYGLFSRDNTEDLEALVAAILFPASDRLAALSAKYGLDANVLQFVGEFVVSAVLRGLTHSVEDDEYAHWLKNVCPVCGSPPVLAWLGRRPPVGKNEFLADGGGKKHLHCSLCGTNWYFLRGICPACGTHGKEAMHILAEGDKRHERIDWCQSCKRYLPLVDLREMATTPDMDAMPLCLMYLDIAAAEKDLIPVKPSFWNMF